MSYEHSPPATEEESTEDRGGAEKELEVLKAHGIFYFQQAEELLSNAGIPCCVMGARALAYYGARRAPAGWEICVPDELVYKATRLFADRPDVYSPGRKIMPQLGSLLHTYDSFISREEPDNHEPTTLYIEPASEWFVQGLDPLQLERSARGVPYPKLRYFAQSLVSTQRWPGLVHLVDGMDLDENWGCTHLTLGLPTTEEAEYAKMKNNKIMSSRQDWPNTNPRLATIEVSLIDRTKIWRKIVGGKIDRIEPHWGKRERYNTQFRRKGSGDPRSRPGKVL